MVHAEAVFAATNLALDGLIFNNGCNSPRLEGVLVDHFLWLA